MVDNKVYIIVNTKKETEVRIMEKYIKNFPPEEAVSLAGQIDILEGQVVSKTLAQNKYVSVTLFGFAPGEEIGTHDSIGDAFVTVIEGTGRYVVDGKEHMVSAGESLLMPAKKPHSVHALADSGFKMLLVVVFPLEQ